MRVIHVKGVSPKKVESELASEPQWGYVQWTELYELTGSLVALSCAMTCMSDGRSGIEYEGADMEEVSW